MGQARFRLRINDLELEITRPVEYRFIDHVYGESVRPLAIAFRE